MCCSYIIINLVRKPLQALIEILNICCTLKVNFNYFTVAITFQIFKENNLRILEDLFAVGYTKHINSKNLFLNDLAIH